MMYDKTYIIFYAIKYELSLSMTDMDGKKLQYLLMFWKQVQTET
jgi:hypothetical protein